MKEHATNFDLFEEMLKQKQYNELSKKEKVMVAEFCSSAQEYALMQKMILAQAPIFSVNSVPDGLLGKVALNAQDVGNQSIMGRSIPLWAYLASMLLVFGLTYILKPNQVEIKETIREIPKEIIREIPKEVIKTDTVLQYAYRVDTIFVEKKGAKNQQKTKTNQVNKASLVINPINKLKSTTKKNQQPIGRTIKQDPDLKAFFTDIQ